MIFKTSPKAPTDDNPSVAMPANQAVTPNDDQMQDDQELAKVLADINNQVNANNDNLAADLERAMNEETTTEATTAEPTTDVAFEKVEEEVATQAEPVMADFQPAEVPTTDNQTAEATPMISNVKSSPRTTEETEPVVDLDQELEAMNQQISASVADAENTANATSTVETPVEPVAETEESVTESTAIEAPIAEAPTAPAMETSVNIMNEPNGNSLDDLRQKALRDLRPIVDKVELNDEESFDVLLLLIRETDDESLLPRAYEAARQIQDEARRAQALLDVIKETDYFKHKV
jgi:hypothetical protein